MPNVLKIVVFPKEDGDATHIKNPNKIYDLSWKCQEAWATQFMWTKMLKSEFGEVHMVKCIVCSFVKGKDVIMGLKFDILEKHARKVKAIHDMAHLGKKKGEFLHL